MNKKTKNLETQSEMALYYKNIDELSAQKKYWNYLYELVEKPAVQKIILKIRKSCGIPDSGIKSENQINDNGDYGGSSIIPEYVNSLRLNNETYSLINQTILSPFWVEPLQHYILYNNWATKGIFSPFATWDVNFMFNGPYIDKRDKESLRKLMIEEFKEYPIAILIGPYTSQNDLLDYIKKTYKKGIQGLQDKYKNPGVSIGKIRTKDSKIKERNDFIYKNRNFSRYKLISMVADKFGPDFIMDQGHIGKIISLMDKKKRK